MAIHVHAPEIRKFLQNFTHNGFHHNLFYLTEEEYKLHYFSGANPDYNDSTSEIDELPSVVVSIDPSILNIVDIYEEDPNEFNGNVLHSEDLHCEIVYREGHETEELVLVQAIPYGLSWKRRTRIRNKDYFTYSFIFYPIKLGTDGQPVFDAGGLKTLLREWGSISGG